MLGATLFRLAATLLAAFLLIHGTDFSCSAGSGVVAPDDGIRVTGVIHVLAVEGGCWQLEARDGTRYERRPEQAPGRVLVDGAEVVLVVRTRRDVVTTCMVGQVVDVERVESVRTP